MLSLSRKKAATEKLNPFTFSYSAKKARGKEKVFFTQRKYVIHRFWGTWKKRRSEKREAISRLKRGRNCLFLFNRRIKFPL